MAYQKELDIALAAVKAAAVLCRSVQSELKSASMEKRDRSPVTVADFGSQAVVCRVLKEAFPEDPVVAEENSAALRLDENAGIRQRVVREVSSVVGGAGEFDVLSWIDHGGSSEYSGRFWTLDPIDGTKGFLRGEQYAIALALVEDGEPVVAALACPGLHFGADGTVGSVFAAVRGEGSFEVPLEGGDARVEVRVSREADPARARFCESVESEHSSHSDAAAVAELLGMPWSPIRLDSQAKYAVVARGEAEIYLRLTKHSGYVENIWDHAAGALVIEESGGRVTDLNGRPLDFRCVPRLERNIGIVATNGPIHRDVLSALEKVLVYGT